MSVISHTKQSSPKTATKSIDKELEILKNRIRCLEIQESKTQAVGRIKNKKAAQLVNRKIMIEELAPLKHRDYEQDNALLQLRRKQIQHNRIERDRQVKDVKQALYLVKRQQADQLYRQKQTLREKGHYDRQQFLSQRQQRHDHIRESTTHDRYLQFMRQKLTRVKLSSQVEHLTKEKEYADKLSVLKTLQQRQRQLQEKLQQSTQRTIEAQRRYAIAYGVPGSKLIPHLLHSSIGESDFGDHAPTSPLISQNIHKKDPRENRRNTHFPTTQLRDKASFQMVLSALRKRHSVDS